VATADGTTASSRKLTQAGSCIAGVQSPSRNIPAVLQPAPAAGGECNAGIRDFSIYVHREAKRRGIARKLLVALFDAARKAGCWKITLRIFPENTASLELCKSLGFRVVGTHVRHARLDGKWRDVVTVERLFDQD
jgi:RimJ/RimL family protein N-acetyltransferase